VTDIRATIVAAALAEHVRWGDPEAALILAKIAVAALDADPRVAVVGVAAGQYVTSWTEIEKLIRETAEEAIYAVANDPVTLAAVQLSTVAHPAAEQSPGGAR